jgi:hypothetical protein
MTDSQTTAIALRPASDPVAHVLEGSTQQDPRPDTGIFTAKYRAKQVDFNGWPPDRPTEKIVLQWLMPWGVSPDAAPHHIEISGPFIPELYSIDGCYEISIRKASER